MIGIPLGLLYSNAAEWLIHKHVLHGVGKKKSSFWNFHWGEHHRNCRRNGFRDPDYERSPLSWNAQGKEVLGVAGLVLAHLPLWSVAPWFTATVAYGGLNYLYKHRRSHLDPEWGKRHLRHHYDHHMGKNQDANWCVTHPFADWVMGTREPFEAGAGAKRRPARTAPSSPLLDMPTPQAGDNTQHPTDSEDAA